MSLTVGSITFANAPVGAVLDRPQGELAVAWRLYADSLERERKLRKKLAKREGRKAE